MARDRVQHRFAVAIAGLGTLFVFGYALLAVLQILWLNPLAAAPGRQLDQVWEDMSAATESLHTPAVLGIMAIGPLLAISVLVIVALRTDVTPVVTAVVYLVILMLGAIAYFVASFGPGMSLADTYGISGGDYSPWAIPLYIISTAALVGIAGIGVATVVRHTRGQPSSDP